jgi:hypothetical protein
MLGEKFDNDPSLEESKYTVLSIDCCSWIQDTEINACLEESEHAALNFSKIGSLLTLIVSRENEDTTVFVYAVASTFKAHRVNFTLSVFGIVVAVVVVVWKKLFYKKYF